MFANTVRQGLRAASRSSVRAMSTLPARAAQKSNLGAGLALGTAIAGYAMYENTRPVLLEGPKTVAGEKGTVSERSFVMIKPDGVSRQLVGKVSFPALTRQAHKADVHVQIISRFEERGYKLVAVKSLTPSPALAKEHYSDLSARPFYGSLVKYITSGTPVVAMVWEGKDVIKQGRRIVGATNPQDADPGSVRGQYAVSVGRNLIHASDAFDSATKEIGLWFAPEELSDYEPIAWPWVMADN